MAYASTSTSRKGQNGEPFDEGLNLDPPQPRLYCGDVVIYDRVCIPRINPSFTEHTYIEKDRWIRNVTESLVWERKSIEMNETRIELDQDEYGNPLENGGDVVVRFFNGDYEDENATEFLKDKGQGTDLTDCEKAYRRFMCYINFPRCDAEGKSLIMCRSVCENYFRACGYNEDMWRCGDYALLGAKEAEVPVQNKTTGQYDVYYNGMFPGLPYRDIEWEEAPDHERGRVPLPVCTPSIDGGAVHSSSLNFFAVVIMAIVTVHISGQF